MHIEESKPTSLNPPDQFAGPVWLDMIAVPHEPEQHMVVATVRFAPGSRTAWHSHAKGQYIRVTQGVGRFGTRDGKIIEVHPGQTLYTPPGQEHWHAAPESSFMEHIAMTENADDPATTTTWFEHISEADYKGKAALPS